MTIRNAGPTFSQLNIVSGDTAASLEFYRRLGVDIPEEFVWRTNTGIHHASAKPAAKEGAIDFDIDSAEFARRWNTGWSGRDDLRGRVVVGFHVPSRDAVDERYADLTRAGYRGLQEPYDAFWGARYAVVEDPDGIAVGLMSPASSEFRSQPPEL
ncbi:MAG: glyoxalase [Candidatus Eremiobacteraeota bacterium]|nr:glyoxalase [Candidatus Eremiobacteraeota bacterium]